MDANERRRRAGEEAAEWWVLLDSENVPQEKRASFVDWLRESPLHVEEMLRVAQVHGSLEHFQRWSGISTDETGASGAPSTAATNVTSLPLLRRLSPPNTEQRAGLRRRTWVGVGVISAAATIAVMWIGALHGTRLVETGQGERRELALSDGSVVQIDPETQLRIRFDSQLRQIDLQRGRARFRVAKNPKRPFLVRADGTLVRAVGTEFGVEHRSRGIVVTVAEGRVAVLPHEIEPFPFVGMPPARVLTDTTQSTPAASGSAIGAKAKPQPAPVVLVSTGQQITVSRGGAAEAVREVNAARELSWAEGRLSFENDSIAAVVEEFNRYNNLQIHIADATLAGRTMSGVFNASDPESFVAFVQSMTSVTVVRNGRDITIASAH
jgi:transmembrane sensor